MHGDRTVKLARVLARAKSLRAVSGLPAQCAKSDVSTDAVRRNVFGDPAACEAAPNMKQPRRFLGLRIYLSELWG